MPSRTGKSGDDKLEEFVNQPIFNFLEPAPWPKVFRAVGATLLVFVLGFSLAYLTHNQGIKSLARPARWTWTTGLLLIIYCLVIGLPRVAKFVIFLMVLLIGGPVIIMMASVYVYTGKWTANDHKTAGK